MNATKAMWATRYNNNIIYILNPSIYDFINFHETELNLNIVLFFGLVCLNLSVKLKASEKQDGSIIRAYIH